MTKSHAINTHTKPRTTTRDWLPNEPGAWAIVLMPALSSLIASGFTWTGLWLLVLWCLCYTVQFTSARWFKSHFRSRYLPPVLVYTIVLCAAGIPYIYKYPGVLWWTPIFAILFAGSLLGSWLRREHSLWANACAVLASCSMSIVMSQFGSHASTFVDDWVSHLPSFSAQWQTSAFPTVGITLACAYLGMLYGSVFYVKTMIRKRGNRTYLALSWIWHTLALACAVAYGNWLITTGFVLLLARAILMPIADSHNRLPVKTIGIGESLASLLFFMLATTAVCI